eukprot:g8336.t1
MARDAANMANQQTPGFMEVIREGVTFGLDGTARRNIDAKDYESPGPVRETGRPLDFSVAGTTEFLVVRDDAAETRATPFGFWKTGHFIVDKDGFVVNLTGKQLMGMPVQPGGTTIPHFSLEGLQPVKIPMDPVSVKESTRLTLSGNLPAGAAHPGEQPLQTCTTGSTVYDSLGAPHHLAFTWERQGGLERVWRLTIADEEGGLLYKGAAPGGAAPGAPDRLWDGGLDTSGIFVAFNDDGTLAGTLDARTAVVAAELPALRQAEAQHAAATDMINHLKTLQGRAHAEIQAEIANYVQQFAGQPGQAGANAVAAIVAGGPNDDTLYATALNAAVRDVIQAPNPGAGFPAGSIGLLRATQDAFVATLNQDDIPSIYAEWNGPAPLTSTITLGADKLNCLGDILAMPALENDGYDNGHFMGIELSPDGRIMMKFTNQKKEHPIWALPTISWRNTNGLDQDSESVLRETMECGQRTFHDAKFTASAWMPGIIVDSNVNPTETAVHYNRASDAVAFCATLYKVANETTDRVLAAIS